MLTGSVIVVAVDVVVVVVREEATRVSEKGRAIVASMMIDDLEEVVTGFAR